MTKIKNYISTALIIPVLMLCLVVSSCSEDGLLPESAEKNYPETFSFMDVGINTLYSIRLRHRLGSILDDDSIQKNNTIDLSINSKTFINDYFPDFNDINLKLNTPVRERVEHKTIKLMYRYAKNKGLAFNYVEFLFSEYTLTPLLIRVHFKQDNLGIREALEKKYGAPSKLNWDKNQPMATALYWEKNHDLMILSTIPDHLGRLTYEINIYFTKRLKDLIETESSPRQTKKGQPSIEKKAF
ncbi:conserved exported hypothetical protein [Desulfamplus magnetovallimortis]|uniref:Lipoprotein n=1 Tax=Desulfamplus magnetovallimortis TaxID=1246637 RepID=A0A1W1HC26_9BACT|nr:hypothetical protein [Desulfamplus magnetovallimortis]SLM30047.1 conserved exported hypothetical protein [Desulfamplus magnetovallimortis]